MLFPCQLYEAVYFIKQENVTYEERNTWIKMSLIAPGQFTTALETQNIQL